MAAVGRNFIASGEFGEIARPNIRLPASPGVERPAGRIGVGQGREALAEPSQSTLPCQHNWLPAKAAGKLNITKYGIVMCQGCSNPRKPRRARPRLTTSLGRIPVVGQLIDEAEPLPFGIGKIDAGHAAGIGRLVVDAVEGERVDALRPARCPASNQGVLRLAAVCRGKARSNSAAIAR